MTLHYINIFLITNVLVKTACFIFRFVPVLGGIGNSFSQVAGIICPTVAGVLTPNVSNSLEALDALRFTII